MIDNYNTHSVVQEILLNRTEIQYKMTLIESVETQIYNLCEQFKINSGDKYHYRVDVPMHVFDILSSKMAQLQRFRNELDELIVYKAKLFRFYLYESKKVVKNKRSI